MSEKQRKSVSFSDGAMVVDANGDVSAATTAVADKNTAENHSTDAAVEEVTDMFKDLAKKKKKKSSKKEAEEDGDGEKAAEANGDEVDLSALKKKKKKKPKAEDFEAKLAEVGTGEDGEEGTAAAETGANAGDMDLGTGIWQHDQTPAIAFDALLKRFYAHLHERHPDLTGGVAKNYKIPPPQCLREGNKKTIFANLADIAKRINRSDEHVTQFLFAELGTFGSTDGARRLVIRGRFQSKQIENVLRRYIAEYVSCKTCRSLQTELARGENRLWYITCQSCGSRRAVPAIKVGFKAQVGKRKRAQG